jgi:phage terminase large subunit GpA-like protein
MKLSQRQKQKFKKSLKEGAKVLYRPPPLTGVEWADKHFYMSSESSYIEGDWVTAPSQIAILNSMCNDDIREINWLKSARVGYTKLVCAAIAYFAEHKKRNTGVWQPDDGARDRFSKKHIAPMLRDVGPIRSIFPYIGKKCPENTIENKSFTNGKELFLLGGKAAKNFRELSLDVAIYDEYSQFDRDIEGDGSATFIGDKRLLGSAFGTSIRGSTPTIKGECQITEAYDECEQKFERYIPCKHCGEFQTLVFGGKGSSYGLEWDKSLPKNKMARSAKYRCKHCVETFNYADFLDLDQRGYWLSRTDGGLATYDGITYYESEGFPAVRNIAATPEIVGWFLWSIYSNFSPWSTIITEWYKAQKTPEALKSFINTTLGEAFEETERVKTTAEELLSRRERYDGQVPDDVVYITLGGDMQDHWAEFTATGWTADEESYTIDHLEVHGDPSTNDFWDQLETRLRKYWVKSTGEILEWSIGAFDSGGHYTDEVYKFCKRVGVLRLFPIKGSSIYGKPVATKPKKKNSHGVYLVIVGTDNAKDILYERIAITPASAGTRKPGALHFPVEDWCNLDYFEQVLAEHKKIVFVKGQKTYRWINPPGKRNEKIDCLVYSLVALRISQQYYGLDLNYLVEQNTVVAKSSTDISDIGRLFNGDN